MTSFTIIPKDTRVFIEVENSPNDWIQKAIECLSIFPLQKIPNFQIASYQLQGDYFESDDFNFVYFYLKQINNNKFQIWNTFIFDANIHKNDLNTLKIMYNWRRQKWTHFKPIFNVNYKNPVYSRREANYLLDLYFIQNPFLKNQEFVSFAKFKLFLKIVRDQITNYLFLNCLSPRATVHRAGWRNSLLQIILDCAVRFLNSNMSILSK